MMKTRTMCGAAALWIGLFALTVNGARLLREFPCVTPYQFLHNLYISLSQLCLEPPRNALLQPLEIGYDLHACP
jgi:hypothetical protein